MNCAKLNLDVGCHYLAVRDGEESRVVVENESPSGIKLYRKKRRTIR